MEIVRVIRVLVYEGSREFVERTLSGSIHGTMIPNLQEPGNRINTMQLGSFPEIVTDANGEDIDGAYIVTQ